MSEHPGTGRYTDLSRLSRSAALPVDASAAPPPAGSDYAPGVGAESPLEDDNPASTATLPSLAYFREGRTITLTLLGAIYLILALSLSGAGWTGGLSMGMLVFVVLGALASGALMAFSRFDSFFMFSHSFATGLAWVFYLMTFLVTEEERVLIFMERGIPALQARAYFLLERWLDWIEAAINRQASNDNIVFIFEIGFITWWLTYLGVWSVFRHGHVWRGVLMAGIALLVNTHYAPASVMGLLVSFCIVALLLLAWTTLVDHRQRWRASRIYFSEDINFDFMRSGFAYTFVVIALAFIAPNMGRNLLFHDMLQPVNQRWESAMLEWNRLYQGLNRQSRSTQTGFGRTLTLGGERSVGDMPILEISAPTGRYWRAVAFDRFTGRQWINTAEEEVNHRAEEPIPATLWAARAPVTQTVVLRASTGNVLLAMPDVVQASIPLAALRLPLDGKDESPATAAAAGQERTELIWARSRVDLDEGGSYKVVSNQTLVTVRQLEEVDDDYPAAILDRYLQLPDNFSPRVAELAEQVMGNAPTTYHKVKALEEFLRNFAYDEGIAAPAADVDPLEYFLFDVQRGYCDYYASAMATMLRSQGIPARTASGYAEGTFDEETGTYLITERDAHTWVEVYFPLFGWIEFEPTAGESLLDRPSGAEPQDSGLTPGMDEFVPDNNEFLLDDGLGAEDELSRDITGPVTDIGNLRARSPLVGTGLALIALTLIAGVWLLRRRMYQGPGAFAAHGPAQPQIYYDRLLDWTARLKMLLAPALTPYERESALAEQLPQGIPFIRRITEIYVLFRYGPGNAQMTDPVVRQALNDNWRQLRPVLWKAWMRRRIKLGPSTGKE